MNNKQHIASNGVMVWSNETVKRYGAHISMCDGKYLVEFVVDAQATIISLSIDAEHSKKTYEEVCTWIDNISKKGSKNYA